jgi:hypothetical protein
MSTVSKDRQRRFGAKGYLAEPAAASELERRLYCQCDRPNVMKPPRPRAAVTGFSEPAEPPVCLKCGRTYRPPPPRGRTVVSDLVDLLREEES